MDNYDKIIEKQIEDEVRNSFLDYSMSVITSRSLPDVRDGMKPVHRRILYSMWDQKMLSKSGFYKSARIVGDVIGKYHPHGDSSVYEALVRMAQPWSLNANLADGHGNFGSMDGDSPAAMRYTEARLSKISEELMDGISKDNVPFQENYDGKEKEPTVLPAKFPNLLVNGVQGIAVGMASNIPTHNLSEVCLATIERIRNEESTVEDLMQILQGPDFPTGGRILGKEGLVNAYHTGRGSFTIRGNVKVEEMDGGFSIIITQLPFQTNKEKLNKKIREIQTLYDEYKRNARSKKRKRFTSEMPKKALNFIKKDGLIDESDANSTEDNVRIVIQLIDGVDPRVVINHLYKYTPLQTSFSFNNTVLIPGKNGSLKPKRVGLLELIDEYIKHQINITEKELNYDLKKIKEELYFVSAMIKALNELDDVLEIIREAKSNDEALKGLIDLLSIDKEQATYILNKRIRSLTGVQQEEIKDHQEQLKIKSDEITEILADEERIKELVIDKLQEIDDKYGRERRTIISDELEDFSREDLIQNEQVVITLSKNGYIKSTKEESYKTQRRNGRGVSTMNLDKDDFIIHLEIMYKHDELLIFSNYGKVYKLKGYDIPVTSTNSKGFHIFNLLPGLEEGEVIQSVISVKQFNENQNLFFVTSNGTVKKTNLSEYENIHRNGIIAISLEKNNRLVNVSLTNGVEKIILVTEQGKSISFSESNIRETKRSTQGVVGIKLRENDLVVSSDIHETFGDLFIVTENGFGKKVSLDQFKTQNRGGSGIIAIKQNDKTGKVVTTLAVTNDDQIFTLSSLGSLIKINSDQISKFNRMARGTKIINLKENDRVITAARLPEKEELEDAED